MSNDAQDQAGAKGKEEADDSFPRPKIPHFKDVLVGELASRGRWVVASVEGGFWPTKIQKHEYRGEHIWIIPITQECYGGVAVREHHGLDSTACQKLLMRFLSAISWVYGYGITLPHGFTGGSFPKPFGRFEKAGISITSDFDLSYCPEPDNEKALLAMALMREGRALNHPAYSFLSFYRVLEVAIPETRRRDEWIATKISSLLGPFVKAALEKLASDGIEDIATHIRESNRHAIAHARTEPVIDPDDPAQLRRLSQELPIIVELAALAIEEKLGVETLHTVYRKHLYELAGFKKVIGDEIIQRILAMEEFPAGTPINVPKINVGLRDREPARPLLNLEPVWLGRNEKSLLIQYVSPDQLISMRFGLNFGDERLDFDLMTDISIRDDRTADGIATIISYHEFSNALFLNGQLHIYDADTGELLGRKDPYMPLNMIYVPEKAAAHLAQLKKIESARREFEKFDWVRKLTAVWDWDWEKHRPWTVKPG